MLFQSATLAECLVAFRTGICLLSCVDTFMIFKSQLSLNDWSLLEQANGVFHAFKVPLQLNVLSHFEQANDFSPVWILS